jgi:hypothetical protein
MQMSVPWDVVLCFFIGIDCFRGAYYRHHQGDNHHADDGESKCLKMLVNFNQTAWCNIPEDIHLQVTFNTIFQKQQVT